MTIRASGRASRRTHQKFRYVSRHRFAKAAHYKQDAQATEFGVLVLRQAAGACLLSSIGTSNNEQEISNLEVRGMKNQRLVLIVG